MTQRSALQMQVFEKLGAPILAAIGEVAARGEGGAPDDPRAEARRVALMLGKAVQASIALSNAMDLKDDDGQADSIRLALASLSGSLIAGSYRLTGRVPEDAEIGRIVSALEAVLSFADNFSPAADTMGRLRALEPGAVPYDDNQVAVLYFNRMVPVVDAVAAFSFGRPEKKLVQEIAGRLNRRAGEMREALSGPAADPRAARQEELTLLAALVDIYHGCHRAETLRLMAMDDAARMDAARSNGGVLSMDPVWDAFEMRVAMLEALGAGVAADGPASSSPFAPAPQTPAQAPPVFAPPREAAAPPAPAQPVQESAPPAAPSGNPMSFFKPGPKKTASGEESAE